MMTKTFGTIRTALRWATQQLREISDSPRLDAELLLMHTLGVDRAGLYQRLTEPLPPESTAHFAQLVRRRQAGEPIAYITGHKEFFGLDLLVSPAVLIPRPETEFLVQWALAWLRAHPGAACVDVGTGSGAIILAIAWHLPRDWPGLLIGSDISLPALHVAKVNRQRLGLQRVQFVCGSLLEWCGKPLDLIVANLPYLRYDQAHAGIAYEPAIALYADHEGFAAYEALLDQAPGCIQAGGILLCEIDPSQATRAQQRASQAFPHANVRVLPDLAGRARYLLVET